MISLIAKCGNGIPSGWKVFLVWSIATKLWDCIFPTPPQPNTQADMNSPHLTDTSSAISRWFSLNMASSVSLTAFSLLRISSYRRLFSAWKRASNSSCSWHSFSIRLILSSEVMSPPLLPGSTSLCFIPEASYSLSLKRQHQKFRI